MKDYTQGKGEQAYLIMIEKEKMSVEFMGRKMSFCFALLFVIFFASPVMAQKIVGIVSSSEQKGRIELANVSLKPGNYSAVTNRNGQFIFDGISEGKYELQISMLGFKTKSINLKVEGAETLTLNIELQREIGEIDEVIVHGNVSQVELMENPMREQASLITGITNISAVQIEKQGAVSLIDALRYTPGAWVETRGRKVKQFFSVRGQKYPYPSYSINGIWQKEFHEMPYFFNSSNISELEVIRSSAALLKSLSALTGVVDVKTKIPGKNELDFFAKYGSLNTYNTGVSYGNSNRKIAYRVGINGSGTNGPKNRNAKENIYNASGYFNWDISKKLSWASNIFYLDGLRELTQPVYPADGKFMNREERYEPLKSFIFSSKLKYNSGGKYSNELYLNYAHRNPRYHNKNVKSGKVSEYDEKDWEITVNQINALALNENNTLRFGALYNYWAAPNGKRFYMGKKAQVHTISGVVTDQQHWGNLLFDMGFRLTQEYYAEWGGFSIEGSGGKFSKVEPIVDQWQSPVWQLTSGFSYALSQNSSLHASFAGGNVNPRKGALNEQGERPENETRLNVDLGFSKQLGNRGLFSATLFSVTRKNAIYLSGKTVEVSEDEIMELYENADKRNYGVELELKSLKLSKHLSLFSNITLMKGEAKADEEWIKDDEMPTLIVNSGVNFQKKRMDINAYVNYIGKYKNNRFVSKDYLNEFGKAPLGDFAHIDFTAGYSLGRMQNYRVFVEIKNLLDDKYQTVPGYPDYGRILMLGFNVNL